MKKRLIFLIWLVVFLFSIFAIAKAQTRDELRQKYGGPDANGHYIVRPGIGLSVKYKYKQSLNPSEMRIEAIGLDFTPYFGEEPRPSVMLPETAEKVLQIRFVHVAHGLPRDDFRQRCQCVMSTNSWPATKRTGQKVLFVDRRQDTGDAAL